jgi:hypothetical protein
MRTALRVFAVVAAVCPLLLTGCDGSPAPAMGSPVDVKGTVTLADGKPLKAGTVHFKFDGAGGRDEVAKVTDGAFELKMFAGKYKVAFDIDSTRPGVPARFTKFESSGQSAEVKGGMSPLAFELK